jgi:hypothetical protein
MFAFFSYNNRNYTRHIMFLRKRRNSRMLSGESEPLTSHATAENATCLGIVTHHTLM